MSSVFTASANLRDFIRDIIKDPRYNDGIKRRIEQYYAENRTFCDAFDSTMYQIGGELWNSQVVRVSSWSFLEWTLLTFGYLDYWTITQIAFQGKYIEAGAEVPSLNDARNRRARTVIAYGGVPVLGGWKRRIPETHGARYDSVKYEMIKSDWDCIRELRKLKSK